MNIITILNEKGGVGKTTLATTLGAGLALRGLRGLLIDTDGQGDTAKVVGLDEAPDCYDFIMRPQMSVRDLVKRVPPDFCSGDLYIVAGNDETRSIPMNRTTKQIQDALIARLRSLRLDFVIFDTQPSPTSLHSAIATITDAVIIPFEPESLSAKDMDSAISNMNAINEMSRQSGKNKARVVGLVPNRFDSRTVLHKQVLKDVLNQYGSLVWHPIPNHIAIPSHQYLAETVMSANPDTKAARALQAYVDRAYKEIFEVSNELP